jgi:hypothetical protein
MCLLVQEFTPVPEDRNLVLICRCLTHCGGQFLWSEVKAMRKVFLLILLCSSVALFLSTSASAQAQGKLKAYTLTRPARDANGKVLDAPTASAVSSLATFSYTVTSSRDGNTYTGAMVGQDPFGSNFTPTRVTTPVIPLIITTNAVATSVNKAGFITTKKGVTTFDPTTADSSCLTAPNDVPLTLFMQSPIFQSVRFKFGHTSVGDTQYLDAFQRGNFWQQSVELITTLW